NLLFDGLVCRFKDMLDGERQIMELHVAGDFVDLHSFVLKRIEHNIGSLTAARFAIVPHEALRRITEGWPHLARLLWFSTLRDAGLVTFRGSEVVIHDWEGLQQAAEFSPSYLYLERRER